MEQYNISQLFNIAFGIKNVNAYNVGQLSKNPTGAPFNYSGVNVIENVAEASRMSYLGTPIIYPLTFKGKKYKVFDKQGDVMLKKFDEFELPAATLLSFRRSKIITKTNSRASKGSVKELFGFNDWSIDIRGLCLADPSHANATTAIAQKIKLKEFDEIVDSIQVVSDLFNNLDISHLVIESVLFNQLKGKPGVIPFHLKCSSDEPLELNL